MFFIFKNFLNAGSKKAKLNGEIKNNMDPKNKPNQIPKKKEDKNSKTFLVVYDGTSGKKAVSLNNAITIGQEYKKTKKIKRLEIYQLIKTILIK